MQDSAKIKIAVDHKAGKKPKGKSKIKVARRKSTR